MRTLHVIHGFPPYYMAGSEVYTYNLTTELSKHIDVSVFTRVENPFEESYRQYDEVMDGIGIRRINKPQRDYVLTDKYLDTEIDLAFKKHLQEVKPDILHVGHLSHLSTNLINIAKEEFDLPVIYTVHDFWLFCVRGQLLTTSMERCPGPSRERCISCLNISFKNLEIEDIDRYQTFMGRVVSNVDMFLSPSLFMKEFFINYGVPEEKLVYSKYGFRKENVEFKTREYSDSSKVTFGFVGRVIPPKGIHVLMNAFAKVKDHNAGLLIYGDAGPYYRYLKAYADERVVFKGGFDNNNIDNVLKEIDVLVVPSIWHENAPLVIQEAFLAGIPVITSNIGGMAELVKDGTNGLLFEVGDEDALTEKIDAIIKNPSLLNKLKPDRDTIRSIEDDTKAVLKIYDEVIEK